MTIDDLIRSIQTKRAAALEARAAHTVTLAELRGQEAQGLEIDPTTVTTARDAKVKLDADLAGYDARIAELEVEKAADDAATRAQGDVAPTNVRKPKYDEVTRVGAEKRTYNPDNDKRGGQFLRDLGSAHFGDFEARDRISQHMREERVEGRMAERAAGTGAFAGLTVPQFLTDLYAPLARAARPFAEMCNHHDLPPAGMTINISRITTGTSAALQTENAGVSETNIDDTLLTENVQTIAGQQTLSRQALERSTGVEDVMLDDLFRAYNTTLDSTLLNQATTGLDALTNAFPVTYVDASPTAAELWPKLLDARQRIEAGLLHTQAGDTVAVMHARRWAWLQSQVGPNWPFIAQNVNNDLVQTGGLDYGLGYGPGYRGNVAGLNIVVDNSIGTTFGGGTEDRIYVVNKREMHLWEDPSAPMLIRAEQPAAASLGVLFVVYGYHAYTFRRYAVAAASGPAIAISGTGLIAPTF